MAAFALLLPLVGPSLAESSPGTIAQEVVVTARKLPEPSSRVPMSLQILSGELLDDRDLSSLYDLQFEIPGLVVNNRGMFGAGLALRGVTDEGGGSVAIAAHIDGIYLGRSNLALARDFDVERIEVLKGPQGTLYGRNATGGAVNIITRAPQDAFGAAVEAAVGTFDTLRTQGYVNLGGDKLAARVAFAGADGNGFIRNSVDSRRFAEDDFVALRASLRARPSERLHVDLMAQRSRDDGASGELWLPRPDFLPDPDDIRLTTVTFANPYLTAVNDLVSANLAYDLGRVTLRSVTGYARNVTEALDDCAATPLLQGCVRSVQPLRYAQWSEELRLESAENDDFRWLLGGYYFESDEFLRFEFSAPLLGLTPVNDYTATSDERAYAVFGDATHALGARWRLGAGLRLSRDEQRVSRAGTGSNDPPPAANRGSWDGTSWRLGLEFSPSESVLFYATVSSGFKSGGVTTDRLPTGEFDDYGPEHLTAYETGVIASTPQRRSTLRAGAFFYDFDDMQVNTTLLSAVVTDSATARIAGLDLSARTQVSDRVRVSAAVVWLPEREFVNLVTSGGVDFSGNKVTRAPEWSLSTSIGYRVPIGGIGDLSADVDFSFRSEFFFTKENDRIRYQGDAGLLNLVLRFDPTSADWYLFASVRNVLDRDYFNQVLIQSAPGYPARYEVGFGWRH